MIPVPLPALELPAAAPGGARLSWDYGLQVQTPLTAVSRWRMRASPPRAFEATLPLTLRRSALRLPEGFNPRTVALAPRIGWAVRAGGARWQGPMRFVAAAPTGAAVIAARAVTMVRHRITFRLSSRATTKSQPESKKMQRGSPRRPPFCLRCARRQRNSAPKETFQWPASLLRL